MKKILFVFDHKSENIWMDGLWAALNLLEKDFEITKYNLQEDRHKELPKYDFVLAWGGFHSPAEEFVRKLPGKKGLCIGGNAIDPYDVEEWSVVFYETDWYYNNVLKHFDVKKVSNMQDRVSDSQKSKEVLFP